MPGIKPHILFFKSGDSVPTDAAYAVTIKATIGKQDLLASLSEQLHFPSYFGNNWDALLDCISDPSWLEKSNLFVVFERFPELSERDTEIFLNIIADSILRLSQHDDLSIWWAFPEENSIFIRKAMSAFVDSIRSYPKDNAIILLNVAE